MLLIRNVTEYTCSVTYILINFFLKYKSDVLDMIYSGYVTGVRGGSSQL